MIGQRLGPYEITAEIGRGGMGYVYRAMQPSLGRTVAVKTLLPHLVADEEFIERFLREARAIAKLSHPGIVTIYDVGEEDGVYYFAMEYLSGLTLDEIVRSGGPLNVDVAVHYVVQIAAALGHAHAADILHRDVKPSNVMVDKANRAVLTDFGIARAASDSRLTRTGTAIGSPDYMSPEQVEGGQQDQRSDLYALGVLFYQLLTGKTPYHGDTPMAVAYQHVNGPVRSPRKANPAVPGHIDAIVCKLMAKKAEDRYESAEHLLTALGAQATASVTAITDPDAATAVMNLAGGRRPVVGVVVAALAVLGAGLAYGAYRYFAPSPLVAPVAAAGNGALSGAGEGASDVGEDSAPGSGGDSAPGGVGDSTPGSAPSGANGSEPSAGSPELEGPAIEIGLDPPAAELTGSDPGPVDNGVEENEDSAAIETDRGPVAETFVVTSRPAGATLTLDGVRVDGVTPVKVDFVPGASHRIGVTLDGYEDTGFEFTLDDLDTAQRDSATLHFPLQPSTPPGRILVRATYAVSAQIGNRTYQIPAGGELSLQPGTYEVTFAAPDVYFSETRRVVVESDAVATVVLAATVSVTVAAAPSYCRVRIDGRDIGFVPVTLDIALGEHEFVFDWERLGETRTVRHAIRADTNRVFASATDGRPS